jgi:hypothetical protein
VKQRLRTAAPKIDKNKRKRIIMFLSKQREISKFTTADEIGIKKWQVHTSKQNLSN